MKTRNLLPAFACVAALAAVSYAAPVRVGFFKGIAPSRYWNTNMHTAGAALSDLLGNPDSANLGPALVKPSGGIRVAFYGVPYVATDTMHLLRTPTAEQKAAFIAALDSLDVVIFSNSTGLDGIFTDSLQRRALERFFKTRGVVGLHWTWQTGGSAAAWGTWDSLPGARSGSWIVSGFGTVRLDMTARDPASRFLNRGLPDTARFAEKWLSLTLLPDALRANPGLKATVTLDSASLSPSNMRSPNTQPYSWYRELPEGGRFFYTGLGDRVGLFTGAPSLDSAGDTVRPGTHFLRRQLYNAILWAAGVDSNGVVSVRGRAAESGRPFSDAARITVNGGALTISVLDDGAHSIELRGVDGRRVGVRSASGRADHIFTDLRPGVHIVAITTPRGRHTRRVMIP